jgi:predicted nucleic acid-binding protein
MTTKSIHSFIPTKQQKFIMDTNVLIKLLYPAMSEVCSKPYEKLFQSILESKAKFIISSVQISEFINRCIRFQFNLWKEDQDNNISFKSDYRETKDYRDSMQTILDIIKADILPYSTCIDDHFDAMDTEKLYTYGFSYDFNDALLAEIARLNNAILITDDKAFGNYVSHIEIVTVNKGLLMFH